MAEYSVQRPGLLVPCSALIKTLKNGDQPSLVVAHKEDILVFEMQVYITVQFSIFACDFFCCHSFDTGKYTEEYKIYKCMLCLKIVYVIGMCVCVCVYVYVPRHTIMSRKQHNWQVWTEITEDRHTTLCIFMEKIMFRCLFQKISENIFVTV